MLRIKEGIDLKELEKFGFSKETIKNKTHKYECENGQEEYYTEILWKYDNGRNTIEILEKRINSDWNHMNIEREIYVYENDYDVGISKDILEVIYDLIKADMVERI